MCEIQVAVISDVHGNRWALEAVLQDIGRRGIREIVNLGDSVYGPLDPEGTAQILTGLKIPTVRGNEDRVIVELSSELDDSPTLCYVRRILAPEHLRWLESLAITCVAYQDFFLCHGSPTRDDEYLLQEVGERGTFLRSTGQLMSRSSLVKQPVLLCGHDHVSRTVYLPNGRLVVNPGSVGLPAYADDVPYPHAMEAGTPHARYSIVSRSEIGWQVEDIALPYDWQTAATVAMEHDRPDWAEWLRTGRANAT